MFVFSGNFSFESGLLTFREMSVLEMNPMNYTWYEENIKLKERKLSRFMSPHLTESGFQNPRTFCLWNRESWALANGIQLKESGIH